MTHSTDTNTCGIAMLKSRDAFSIGNCLFSSNSQCIVDTNKAEIAMYTFSLNGIILLANTTDTSANANVFIRAKKSFSSNARSHPLEPFSIIFSEMSNCFMHQRLPPLTQMPLELLLS
ncbi:hypothetical protein V6N11_081414 [Hibiscus sabdariffa]|uniref:Uncharacterized protein n=2 Tax=Hibiscus sabdariffa TaxID=183260 RepID=A0ABR2BBE0_9ROSI